MREKNLFYGLTSDDENATTELLCNLFGFDEYKNIILSKLGLENFQIEFEDIDTQYQISEKKIRPDIVIKNDAVTVFIENKICISRDLEPSQKTDYPEYLKSLESESKKVKLIFLIPRGHKDENDINLIKQSYHFITIVYWDELLKELKNKNKTICSEILKESIVFFEEILPMIIKFEQKEIRSMKDTAKFFTEVQTINKTIMLLKHVCPKIKKQLYPEKRPQRVDLINEKYGIGCWIVDECFIGFSFKNLNNGTKLQDFVLSIAIKKNVVIEKKRNKLSGILNESDDEWHYFKITPEILDAGEGELLLFSEKIINLIDKEKLSKQQ